MPTADEMLAGAVEEQYILVDLNTRLLNIPKSITNIGVESDDDVLRLPFKMPRYLGEFDLSEFKVRVNYLNARKLGDLFEPDDITVTEDGYITFTWLVGRYAAAYKGNVSFNVCLKKYDVEDPTLVVKEFNTTIAILPVLEGLETAEAVVAAYVDILEAWKTELFNIYDNIKDAVDDYIESLSVSSVISVNGETGDVQLTHEDVGAAPADINYADVGAAPAGYGLGDISKVLTGEDNLNNMSINGWYSWGDTSPMNAPVWNAFGGTGYAYMRIDNSYDGSCVQTVYDRMDGLSNIVQMRTCMEGVWSEWEWINPPMEAGIEYRTTDRIGGKAVYKKNVDGVIHYRLDGETTWQPYAKADGAATRVGVYAEFTDLKWSDTVPYTQTVEVEGVLSTDVPILGVCWYNDDTSATHTLLSRITAWNCVDKIVTGDGTLTAYCYAEKPQTWFSVYGIIVR